MRAGVDTATLGGVPLPIHTLGLDGDQLLIIGADMSPIRIPIHEMKALEVSARA